MLILALDSSGKCLSIALLDDERILAERILNLGYTHSQTLMPQLLGLLEDCGKDFSDLELLAAAAGPGSYTGIRIGLSAMKTLAWKEELPLYGISSLAAIAEPLRGTGLAVLPSVDARGGRVFSAVYRDGDVMLPEKNRQARDLLREIRESDELCDATIHLLGNGSRTVLDMACSEGAGEFSFQILDPGASALRASAVGLMALDLYRSGTADEVTLRAEPRYLSLAQADRLRQEHERANSEGQV